MQKASVLILAAGKGERMRSKLPKVLHPLGGRPILSYVLETSRSLKPASITVVVGHGADEVKKAVKDPRIRWVLQRRQRGTADAVRAAWEKCGSFRGPLYILCGDVPLLKAETLAKMREAFEKSAPALTLLTATLRNPIGYGRVIRNGTGRVSRIVEEREATDEERAVREINTGIYLVQAEEILAALKRIGPSAVRKEYYLTDLVGELAGEGRPVEAVAVEDPEECLGINSREELAAAEGRLQQRIRERWMRRGVSLRDPDSIWIGPDVVFEPDVLVHRGAILEGACRVGRGAEVLPYSVIESSRIGRGARIGPFSHLRPGSVVGDGAHVGNFVELKKANLKKGAKANHLSYLGDTVVGERTNIGAGTITCNYDGFKKHRTVLGRDVFVGSDVQFVAPVKVGRGAWIGAGTTVTRNVPSGALAVSRVEQRNMRGWVRKKRRMMER